MAGFLLLKKILPYAIVIAAVLIAGVDNCYFATFYPAEATQEGSLALIGATVLAGEEMEPRTNTTVLLRDGTIVNVGDDGSLDIPYGTKILDLEGYTLMPGLIDMHVHIGSSMQKSMEEGNMLAMLTLVFDYMRYLPGTRRAFLENGVTTVRDLGNEHGTIMELRSELNNGRLEGPHLFAAGPIFTTTGGHPVATFSIDPASDSVRLPVTPEEARKMVLNLSAGDDHVDLIKIVQDRGKTNRSLQPIAPDVLDAIVNEAHRQDLFVTAHRGTREDLQDVLAAGVDGLEQMEPRAVLDGWPEGVLDVLVERNIPVTPTLAVTDAVLPEEISRQLRQRVGEFHTAGGRIVVGSDAPINGVLFGEGVHRELELLVESRLTPRDALRAATSESASVLGTDQIGAIEPGRRADLVVVKGNPHEDIRATRNVIMVFRDGRIVVDHRANARENGKPDNPASAEQEKKR